jgi:hypothetical protein
MSIALVLTALSKVDVNEYRQEELRPKPFTATPRRCLKLTPLSTRIEGIADGPEKERIGTFNIRWWIGVIAIGQLKSADETSEELESHTLIGCKINVLGILDRREQFIIMVERDLLIENRPVPFE